MSEDKLSSFLKTGSDWGRMKTSIPGIFILKLPAYKTFPARVTVELNPVDESGSPTKKRGLVIRSLKELDEYAKLLQYDKLSSLLKNIDKVNPSLKKPLKPSDQVLEI